MAAFMIGNGQVPLYIGGYMEALRPFTFNEKFAAGLFVLFCPVFVVAAALLYPVTVLTSDEFVTLLLWQICWSIIGFLAFCATVATVFFKPDFHPSRLRMNIGRILPITALIVAVILGSVAVAAITNHQLRAIADQNTHALAGTPPRAVIFREGIPDGGYAIVRSPGRNPETFTQTVMIDLTGERIKSCQQVSEIDWSCKFD